MFHCNLLFVSSVMLINIMFIVPCSSNSRINTQQQSKSRAFNHLADQQPQGNQNAIQDSDGHFLPMTTPNQQPQLPRSQQQQQLARSLAPIGHHRPPTSNHQQQQQKSPLSSSPFYHKGHSNQFGASNKKDKSQIYGSDKNQDNNRDQPHQLASPTEFDAPLIVASGAGSNTNQLAASNILYDQTPMALQSMANGNQEQLVNSFYVGGFGTQPMMGQPPPPPTSHQILNANGLNINLPSPPGPNDIYGTAAQQNYNSQPEQGPYMNYDGGGGGVGIQGLYGMGMQQSGLREQAGSRSRGPDREEDRYTGETSGGDRKMLSNDQLMSLIDELKEFNSKEASKLSNLAVQPDGGGGGGKPDGDNDADDRDNDADGAVPVKKIETSIETKKFPTNDDNNNNNNNGAHNDIGSDDDGGGGGKSSKGGDDDLVNIAKFLLTKEGAKIRLQLGLDDSDGDDDDEKDQLLESKTSRLTQSNNLRENKLNRFVTDSLAKNRKSDSGKGDNVRRSASGMRRQNENDKDETYGEPKDSESYERARKRRDHHEIIPKTATTTTTKRPTIELKKFESNNEDASKNVTKPNRFHSNDGSRKRDNFAKLLIKSELLADKLESAQNHSGKPISLSSNARRLAMPSSPAVRIVAAPTIHTRRHLLPRHFHNFQGLDMAPKRGELGQRKEKYSRDERDHDREVMLDKLEQVREAKAKMRSRIPMPMIVPVVKRALNGEMRMRVDKSSTGDHLLLRNNMGEDMRFKLPQARKYGNSFDKKQPITSGSSNIIDNGRLNASAPIPALLEPEKGQYQVGRASIRLQSELPLKDEYPISDRVNDRLNKLSNSLDRYFNDGFLQEIESKSKLEEGGAKDTSGETGGDLAQGGGDTHKAEPSSHNELSSPTAAKEAAAAVENNRVKHKVASLTGKDHDFDINVSVDGKRDAPDRDPEDDLDRRIEEGGDKDDDGDEDDSDDRDDRDGESGKAPSGKQTKAPKKGNKKKINERKQASRKKDKPSGVSKDSSKKKETYNNKKTNNNKRVKPRRRQQQPTGDDVEFENLGKLIDNMDPVENETLDTPIGPDGASKSFGATKVSKASQEENPKTSNESSSYGKKTSFYQEPD